MKYFKILFVLSIAIAMPGQAKSQFTLTPNGFVSSEDSTKNFIVIKMDTLSQGEIFKKTLIYLNSIYASPKDVLSIVDSSMITVNGYSKNRIYSSNLSAFNLNYTISFVFKNNRLKINAPGFTLTQFLSGKTRTMYVVANSSFDGTSSGIWTNKGVLAKKRVKLELEEYFNAYVKDFLTGISKKEEW